ELAVEVPDLGHGILTYSLLAGSGGIGVGPLVRKSLSADKPLDVLGWFGYAQAKVPSLYLTYVGRPQQVEVSGFDQPSFLLLSPFSFLCRRQCPHPGPLPKESGERKPLPRPSLRGRGRGRG